MYTILCTLFTLLSLSSSSRLRTASDIDTESVVNYLASNAEWLRNHAELHINSLRDAQGRIGPITMSNILLGELVGDMELPKTAPAPSKVIVKFKLAVVDPTAGSAESEQNTAPQTTVELLVPVDISADMGLMIDAPGMHVTTAFFDGKAISLVEMDSGAQDAPRPMETKEDAQAVIDRLTQHINEWRKEKCGSALPAITSCGPLANAVLYGWVVDAGPGQQSQVTAAECGGGNKFVGAIDVPRGGQISTGMFGGTIPGPCKIGVEQPPVHLLPTAPASTTAFIDLSKTTSPEEQTRLNNVRDRINGDREAFMSKSRFSKLPLIEANKFDEESAKKKLPKSFDPRKDDLPSFPGSAKSCFQAPNRVRNQRDCMSCWAFASATVYTDRKCLADIKLLNGKEAPPPTLYSPASALSCRRPPTCLLGGFTNFVSMIGSGISTETCFPYKLKTDGESRYVATTGEMYADSDVVPECPLESEGGNGMCPGDSTQKYVAESVKDEAVYRIHDNPTAIRMAIYEGGSVTAAISWSGNEGHHFTNYGAGGPACGQEGAAAEGICSKFKLSQEDPITLKGRSKLPPQESGGHAAGHAVSIIGWTCQDHPACDQGSWIIQNSWGDGWGTNGIGHVSFGAMDIESQIYFIDVAGVYDEKLQEKNLESLESKSQDDTPSPDEILRHDSGVVHDHGGSLFFVKAIATGHIAEKQNPGAFGDNTKVVTIKWKLTKGGICTVGTFSSDGKSVYKCPIAGGSESWDPTKDLTGCPLVDSESGMIAIGNCDHTDDNSNTFCDVSHSATPEDSPADPMDQEGSSGMSTESKVNDFLQEKFVANIVLKTLSGSNNHYRIDIRCTFKDEESKVTDQAIEIDPMPSNVECTSKTLKSFGDCKDLVFSSTKAVDGKSVMQSVKGVPKKPPPTLTTAQKLEQAKKNELQAENEANAEMKQAKADEAASGITPLGTLGTQSAASTSDKCPVKHLKNVDTNMDDATSMQQLKDINLTEDEMNVLSDPSHGHGEAWNDCSPQQKLAMAKQFKKVIGQ